MKIRPTEKDTTQNTPRHTTMSLIIDAATMAGVDMNARERQAVYVHRA
jgi:hypothetical protein